MSTSSPLMYVKRSPEAFFRTMSKKLNYSIQKKDQKAFIRSRLNLLDWHYCSQLELHLWQSYLDIGLEQHQWPVSFLHPRDAAF